MPVPVFCCFCIPEKLVWKYSRNLTKLHGDPYFIRRHLESEGETKWSHEGPMCRSQISARKSTVKTLYFWSTKNISKKTDVPILSEDGLSQKGRLRWARRGPHHPWARPGISRGPRVVSPPRAPSRDALSPTYSSRRENPKCLDDFLRKVPELRRHPKP